MKSAVRLIAVLLAALLAGALLASSCSLFPVSPVGPVNPTAAGSSSSGGAAPSGAAGAAGRLEAGGSANTGGAGAVAGAPATGGSSAILWPKCDETRKAGPIQRHPLQPRRKVIHKRKLASYQMLAGIESKFFEPLLNHALDQGALGSCTGEAPTGIRLSRPYTLATLPAPWVQMSTAGDFEQLARDIYSGATKIDPYPGEWPPTDTGSNGDSAMRMAVQLGLFSAYRSIEAFTDLQASLQAGPCIFGSDWYTGMWQPDRGGQVHVTGAAEGGHEYGFAGIDVDRKLLWFVNSWGDDYGCKVGSHGGYFNLTFGDFTTLYNSGGAVECPSPPPANDNALLVREAS
jgi:hypothetical protein